MAIEKIITVDIKGGEQYLDQVLICCARSGMFQPENAAKLSEYSVGAATMVQNPYGGLLADLEGMASRLQMPLSYRECSLDRGLDREQFIADAQTYLGELRQRCREGLRRGVGLPDDSPQREELRESFQREEERLDQLYSQVKFLHDAYDLRRNAVVIRGQFHVVGFVLARQREDFLSRFSDIPEVTVEHFPAESDSRLPVPVKLRNNWFVRPFELFVEMYGSPAYGDIDPTPFVAYTYALLFGMMFGDLGHGLCVCLLGLYLGARKGMALGRIMSRIGAVSMVFGFAYGSVFGFEHLLDPVFRRMGFAQKPISVMEPATTNRILIAAIGIGAVLILMVILFNMLVGIRHRDIDRTLLSHNGLAGLVLYGSVLFAAVMTLTGHPVINAAYVICLIALPLLVIFFREPIARLHRFYSQDAVIHSDRDLEESTTFHSGTVDIPQLFTTRYISARFGRIPTDSYKKLEFYADEPFVIYPLKTDREYIWCIYAMAAVNKEEIDAIFHDLFFERIYIPTQEMENREQAEAFIRRVVDDRRLTDEVIAQEKYGEVRLSRRKTLHQIMFPEGVGGFLTQSFFELFEVCLSFVTNTMSYLRVGGFILVHAGMMEVVFQLSEMVGGGAAPVIIVVGNLFVMAMEGLIVGIQVLRLEFYEIFSRFYDAGGQPFHPLVIQYSQQP